MLVDTTPLHRSATPAAGFPLVHDGEDETIVVVGTPEFDAACPPT
ncbi:MAG: hypothetical protein AAGG08_07810 [Actinomycetota bacterium]